MVDLLALADRGLGALEDGLDAVGEYVEMFVSTENQSGIALAKILHGVNSVWTKVDKEEGDTFKDWAMRSSGLALATIHKRICSWEFLVEFVPPQHKETFMKNWNVGMLDVGYKVAVKHRYNKKMGCYNFLPSGYEIEPADWLALSECVDLPMVLDIKSRIDGKEPNANRISFSVTDDGEIVFYRGKKERAVIGTLYVGSNSVLVQDGVTEVMSKLGVK